MHIEEGKEVIKVIKNAVIATFTEEPKLTTGTLYA
jgi:hypothetical protein